MVRGITYTVYHIPYDIVSDFSIWYDTIGNIVSWPII
jgi:hypothetical protein